VVWTRRRTSNEIASGTTDHETRHISTHLYGAGGPRASRSRHVGIESRYRLCQNPIYRRHESPRRPAVSSSTSPSARGTDSPARYSITPDAHLGSPSSPFPSGHCQVSRAVTSTRRRPPLVGGRPSSASGPAPPTAPQGLVLPFRVGSQWRGTGFTALAADSALARSGGRHLREPTARSGSGGDGDLWRAMTVQPLRDHLSPLCI